MATLRPLHLWHLTSLDAPTVAVTWLLAFAWAQNIHLPLWLPITLALITWSFYIADRLLDAYRAGLPPIGPFSRLKSESKSGFISELKSGLIRRLKGTGFTPYIKPSKEFGALAPEGNHLLRPRHLFHWNHRRLFLPTALVSALAVLAIVHHNMPPAARERNTLLAAATLLYFTSVHNPWRPAPRLRNPIPKELLVGILFTLACTLPTLGRMSSGQSALSAPIFAPVLAFIALAWLNCHAIETWESTRHSILLPALSLLLASLLLTAANYHHPRIALLLISAATSAALLGLLDLLEPRLQPTTLRALADLVLLTPLPLLFLHP